MATKPKVGQIAATKPRFEYVDVDRSQLTGARFYDDSPVVAEAEAPEAPGMLRRIGDTAVQFGQGAVTGVKMMSDIFGANNAVSSGLSDVNQALDGLLSATAQGDKQKVAQIMQEAEGKGWGEQIVAGLKAAGVDPVGLAANALGTTLPTLATLAIPGAGPAAVAARTGAGIALGAGQGVGSIKGQIYDETKRKWLESGATPEQAEAKAQEAAAYGGQNTDQIALGGVLGMASVLGAERALGKVLHGSSKAGPGMLGRVSTSTVAETGTEAAQGGQEKYASNLALNRQGFDVDPMSGVIANATLEGAAAAPMGAVAGIPRPAVVAATAVDPAQAAADAIRATEKVPESGALTKAVNAGVEAKAQAVEAGGLELAPLVDGAAPEAVTPNGLELVPRPGEQAPEPVDDPVRDQILALPDGARQDALRAYAVVNRTDVAKGVQQYNRKLLDRLLAENQPAPEAAPEVGGIVRNFDPKSQPTNTLSLAPMGEAAYDNGIDFQANAQSELARRNAELDDLTRRAPRTSTAPVDLSLPTDPVQNYLDNLRGVNTPAARAYVRDFDAGRITPADVQRRMQAEQGLTPEQRIARAAAEAPAQTDPVADRLRQAVSQRATPAPTDILNPAGKPFKTRKAAGDAKKLQPMMRVVTVPGGYALAEKTPAQLAAEERASRRLRNPNTSAPGEPIPAHAFIAAAGGLSRVAAADIGVDGNPRIGNRTLFAGQGRGLSMEQATQMLIQDGYLSEGASINDALALIKTSLARPQYNADGIERIAKAEVQAQFEDYLAAQEESGSEVDPWDDAPATATDDFSDDMLEASGYDAATDAIKAEVRALLEMANAQGIDAESIMLDAHERTRNATEQDYYEAAKTALEAAITGSNRDRSTPAGSESQGQGQERDAANQELNQPETLTGQAQAATETVAPGALELAAQTPAEAAALQDAQEQAAKAEAAAKRAADAAAAKEEDRKRIAQASVRAADRFDLGQDPLDSLTGQGSIFDAPEPAPAPQPITRADVEDAKQQARADNRKKVETKEDDTGNVAMFSRTGAQSANANESTSRAWYDRFVSLLPESYRNDPHRREPLPAEDWNVQRAAEVRGKVESLNKQLRGKNDRKGYGPISIDGLGNLQVSALDVSVDDLDGPIKALANELGAGIAVTKVRAADVQALQRKGFAAEISLAPVADRIMGRPFVTPANAYATDAGAQGAIMTYKPRGFPAVLFARDTAIPPADSNARNVATQLLVDGLKAKWTRAPEIIVARNMQDAQIPQAVRDYDAQLKSQGSDGEARGFIYKGKVYLLSDQLKGPQQIAEVLFHEVLGHYGLRGAFGDSLNSILQQMGTMRRRDVVAKAREYGLFNKDALGGLDKAAASDAQIWAAMSAKQRLEAAEEVLAELSQVRPTIGFVQRAMAAIRNWLRANVPGFKSLRLTDADIIQAYILPARGFVTRSKETGAQSLERAMAAFSRDTNTAMTNNDVVGNQGGRSADDSTPGAMFDAQAAFEKHGGIGDVDESTDITAKSLAFAEMAESQGWTVVGRGDKYVTLKKHFGLDGEGYPKNAVIKARISDHSNVNRGVHFGEIDINIAPDDGYGRDTFEDALRKIRSAYVTDDLDTVIPNEPTASDGSDAPMYSRTTAQSIASSMGDMTPDQEKAYKNVAGVKAVPTVRERMDALKANLGLKLRQGLVDQFAAIKQLDQNAYVQARMSKGTDGTLEAMLMYGKPFMRDGAPDVDVKDGGFAKVLASLKGEQDRWMMWIAAQRAEKLKADGKENLMTDDDISALKTLNAGKMADGTGRAPIYAKALQELNDYNDAMLKLAMDSGLIDQAAYDLMAGQPYVPFYRLMEDGDMKGPKFSSGLTNQKAWQKLKGGTQQLNADLLQNMMLNWSHLLQASAKNRAATATMDAAEKMAVAYKVDADTKGAVKVMRDGSAEYWMVEDPYLLDAISAIHYVPSPLMKPLAKFKQLLTWGVTVNPTFKIRNLIRDSVSAIAQSELGYNPAANVAKGWKLTAKDSQIYASMLASGGLIKFGTQENTDRLRAQVAKLGGVMLDKSGAERFFGQIKDLYDVYNEFGDRAENVNRAALYDALIKKGKPHAEAAFMARDLMDFSMGGSAPVVRFLTQTVPFLNARLVGLDKLGRAAIEDPRRFAAVTGAVALASLALMAGYSDDEDWKKREDWDRDAYWWFKIGGQAYRIPKPFEVGAIGTLAERTAELMFNDEMTGKRYMERVSHMLSGTFSFNPVPQAFKPLLDLYANKDSFTGRAIESQADQRLRPQDRYSERTPEVAKFLGGLGLPDPAQLVKGEYSALSPKQVEHLVRGYFSWVGTAAMTVSDFGLRPLAGRGERPDMRLKDVFIAGNFVENLPTGSSRYVTQMYEQSRQVEQAYASYQEAIKAGDTEKAQSIKESAGPLLRNRPAYTAATRQLAEINRTAKRIEADQAMAGAAKRARLTQLEQQRQVIAQRVSRLAAATP